MSFCRNIHAFSQTFSFFSIPPFLFGDNNSSIQTSKNQGQITGMNYMDATIYGIIEGVTEFLPISSTGHLIIAGEIMTDTPSQQQKEALNAYLIVIQGGAILAVALIYRSRVLSMVLGLFGINPKGRVTHQCNCCSCQQQSLACC